MALRPFSGFDCARVCYGFSSRQEAANADASITGYIKIKGAGGVLCGRGY